MTRITIRLAVFAALLTLAVAGVAQARNGADDPATDDRGGATELRQGADDPATDDRSGATELRSGADDAAGDDNVARTPVRPKSKRRSCHSLRVRARHTHRAEDRRRARRCTLRGRSAHHPAGHR